MDGWIPISEWHRCVELEKPGIVFEIINGDGLSLFTSCTGRPATPHGWTSPPVKFRPVAEEPGEHSSPLPPPLKR